MRTPNPCSAAYRSLVLIGFTAAATAALTGCHHDSGAPSALESTQGAVVDTPPTLTVSAGTTSYTAGNAALAVDGSLTLTDPDGPDLTGARVAISTGFVSGQDVLAFTNQSGIVGSWNSTTGIMTLTGSAPASSYETALRSVTYVNTSASPNTAARAVTYTLGATSLYSSDTGHYYEFVSSAGVTWTNARTAAAARSYYGMQGYLVTVTSALENSFVSGKLAGQGWMGASDAASEGVWRWVTGPEGLEASGAGRQFWQGLSNGSVVNGQYRNWSGGEPNNCCSGENYAHFLSNGAWNDYPDNAGGNIAGYVAEYGGMPGDPTLQLSGIKNLSVSQIPTYTIVASASANGSITPTGTTTLQQGQSQAYTITANTNYVATVTIDGTAMGALSSYTFSNVTANHTISVAFTFVTPPTITPSLGNNQTTGVSTSFATPLTVLVTDGTGTPLSGRTVVFTAPGSGASASFSTTTATTTAAGLASTGATANGVAGSYSVTATVSGTSASTTFSLGNYGAAASITVVSGSGQTAAAGQAFASLIAVVKDAASVTVRNASVTFTAPSTGATATLGTSPVVTGSDGRATMSATAGGVPGSYSVTAAVTGVATPATFSLMNLVGAPGMITAGSGGGQTATVGTAFAAPLVVIVKDAFGNAVSGAAVTFAPPATGASATVTGGGSATVTTGATGQASLMVTANAVAGTYNVTATVSGVGQSATFSLVNQPLLILSPAAASVAPRQAVTFGASGGSGSGYVYSMSAAPSGGTINPVTGVYTAGATPNVTDIVKVTDGASHTATANVTVGAGLSLVASVGQVPPRGAATFTASGGTGLGLVFVVGTNRSGASIDAAGHYTAGQTGSVTDIITVTDSVGNGATVSINVTAGASLAGSATQAPPRGALTFSATGGAGTFQFALATNASGGSIDTSTGAYTAGATPDVVDVVSATDALGNVANANVAVGSGVTLSPPAPAVAPRGTLTFSASGGSGTGFHYVLTTTGSGGTIDADTGLYTAGTAAMTTDVVKVSDSLGNTDSVSVSVGGGITVTPPSVSLAPRASQTLVAGGGSGSGYSFTLTTNASGATVGASTGVYTAGPTGSVSDVVKVSDPLGNSTSVTIAVGAIVTMSPAASMRAPLGTVTFSVAGGAGSGYTYVVTTNASGGSVDATGVYTAGPVGGVSDVVTVTDALGNTATASVALSAALTTPASTATVTPSGTFTLTVTGGAPPYVFALTTNGSGGHVDPMTGVYVAGTNGDATDVITVTDQNGATAAVVVTVGPAVAVLPAAPATTPQGTVHFGATGGSGTGYHYALTTNASHGTIDPATGVYVAGAMGAVSDVVTVTDSLGNTAMVSVSVGGGLTLNLPSTTVSPRETATITATAGSGAGYHFTLSINASGATLDATTGVYTAGPLGSVTDEVSAGDSLGNTATISITVGPQVTLMPQEAAIYPRGSLTFAVSGGSGTGYSFDFMANRSGATISDTGAYTAGAVGGVFDEVRVTDSLGNSAMAPVTVGSAVVLTASAATVPPRGTAMFVAVGGSGGGYVYVLRSNGSGGNIVTTTGAYTAGDMPDTTDVVEVTDPFGNHASLSIAVGPGISIAPAAPAVGPNGTLMLVASGGSGTGFVYKMMTNASGGSVDRTTGAYHAGATSDVVDVVNVNDSLGNTATVAIAVGNALTVNPHSPHVSPRGKLHLVPAGGTGQGFTFTFKANASGGTVDPMTGDYTAGALGDVIDVVTVTDSAGNHADVSISVEDGLRLTPALIELAPLGHLSFTVAGGSGAGYVFSLATAASGGTVDVATGAYVAGPTGGVTDVVRVTDSLGNTADAQVKVSAALALTAPPGVVPPRGTVMLIVKGGAGGVKFTLATNASGGAVNPTTGAYTAGSTGGASDVVKATDVNGATAMVTVKVGPALAITPVTTALKPGMQAMLVASGGSGSGLVWSMVASGSGGTVDATTGLYHTGTQAGTDVVRVTDSLMNTTTIQLVVGDGTGGGGGGGSVSGGGGCGCSTSGRDGSPAAAAAVGLAIALALARRRRAPRF